MSVCKKCGAEFDDNTKFCPECGTPANESTTSNETIELRCKACNGIMTQEKDGEILVCPFCGSKELIKSSDTVAVEKIKQQTEFKKWEREDLKEQQQAKEKEERSYKFGAFGTISIVFAVICGFVSVFSFIGSRNFLGVLAGIIALVQMLLFLASVITRRGLIKSKLKYLPTLLMVAGFVLFIPYFITLAGQNNIQQSKGKEFGKLTWPDSKLAQMLPKAESEYGEVRWDRSDSINIYVGYTEKNQFEDYVNKCKEKGFTKDYDKDERRYSAYNEDDYSLRIYYDSKDKYMNISLDEPLEYTSDTVTTTVPTTTKATEKPTQKPTQAATKATEQPAEEFDVSLAISCEKNTLFSKYDVAVFVDNEKQGEMNHGTDKTFSVTLSKGKHTLRVEKSEDSSVNGETTFEVTNSQTYMFRIKCTNNQVEITKSENSENESQESKGSLESAANSIIDEAVSPDFKETMDSYEAWFDEYIAFMKKYSENPTDLEMLEEYSKWISDYSDYMEKLDSIDEDSLSAADLAYYLEVQTRITEKLANI